MARRKSAHCQSLGMTPGGGGGGGRAEPPLRLARLWARQQQLVPRVAVLLHLASLCLDRRFTFTFSFLARCIAKNVPCSWRTNGSNGLISCAAHFCPATASLSSSRCASCQSSEGPGTQCWDTQLSSVHRFYHPALGANRGRRQIRTHGGRWTALPASLPWLEPLSPPEKVPSPTSRLRTTSAGGPHVPWLLDHSRGISRPVVVPCRRSCLAKRSTRRIFSAFLAASSARRRQEELRATLYRCSRIFACWG